MPKEVSFVIKLDDKGTFKKVTVDAEELGRAVRSVQDESEKAKRAVLTWSEASQAIGVLQDTIGELQGVVSDLTSAYQVQLVAETQLQTIMRQRMGATDAEIQSVKDLCSAQQELGVIGDEVQLSGAQQMATFLQNKQSLDVLIPAMNNLVAQQNGLNATNQDAVSIGNMMGKAMQGQVEVLQRVGITFTDAQKQVLQFGNESERAAMLAQVITDNVGNMNAELAKTDAGKWKQTSNWLGDIKEKLGEMVQGIAPAITMLSQLTIAGTGVAKLSTSIYASVKAVYTLTTSTQILSQTKTAAIAISRVLSACYHGETIGATTAAVATRALGVAVKSLLVSTGVGLAVVALGEAISYLTSSSDDATNSVGKLSEAEEQAKAAHQQTAQQIASVRSEMDLNIAKLKDFKGNKEQEKSLVQQMNSKYGEAIGYYSTVGQWYTALTSNSKAYCNQMINEIRLRKLANLAANLKQQQHDIKYNADGTIKKYSAANKTKPVTHVSGSDPNIPSVTTENVEKKGTSQLDEANRKITSLYRQEQNVRKEMQKIVAENNKISFTHTAGYSVTMPGTSSSGGKKGGITSPTIKTDNTPKTHIEKLQDQLKKEQEKLGNATTIDAKIKADAKVKDIQGEIDEATKGKVTIGAQVDSSYIVQGSDADKRLSRNNAQQRIDRIKQDYDIGIIADKSEAQRQIDDLNKQLTELGLKPIEVHWETHTEELQRQLQDAQREFDNATTIEAKLKASAKLADLQAQIDTETKGRLTIAADVDPSYIEQGSIADKRKSYSNAQTKASRIQQDFEIGIIGKDEAEKQIEDLNNQLSKLGKSVKPIKLDPSSMVKTDGFSKVMDNIKDGWGGIQGIGGGIQGITDALDGNKNAWQALSGVINGFISVAEGIQGIVQFVNMLTTATQAKSAATTADTAVTAANTAVTTTNTAAKAGEAITNVTASGAKLPFPANIAAIAAGVAAVVAALAMISGAFADGGVVGGNSPSGDKLLARVNSGEMILNAAQQARLFAIADGTAAYGASAQIAANFAQGVALPSVSVQTDHLQGIMADGGGKQPQAVEWRLRGRDIVASIANETRSNRKRSNIRLK
uniref:hypothetical protein n=1 Tax=Prevotella sp. TaxID=59823 RepID=UPI004028672B